MCLFLGFGVVSCFLANVKVMAHPLAGANVDRGVEVETWWRASKTEGLVGVAMHVLFGFLEFIGLGVRRRGNRPSFPKTIKRKWPK